MADTLSMDTVVGHVLARGGNVRLIGDDQQLAAIGAGGVLRDIQATHGALRLTELVRFTDRAEGSASLALREGQTAALGFYLDQRRIHVGDETTMADDLFAAWSADRADGLDSIMLAPTRDLVSELNQRARDQRLNGDTPTAWMELSDGNTASVGDTIITRTNNRRLRTTATDWVKNGDRWTVTDVDPGRWHPCPAHPDPTHDYPSGRLRRRVRRARLRLHHSHCPRRHSRHHARPSRRQRITSADLHDADPRSRSQSRLRRRCRRRRPAHDDPSRRRSIPSLQRTCWSESSPATSPQSQLPPPCAMLEVQQPFWGKRRSATATRSASPLPIWLETWACVVWNARSTTPLPRLTDAATWPALRTQLLAVQAADRDPIDALARACAEPLSTAHDPCSVLAWRVADSERNAPRGPLPWLPTVPSRLAAHPVWGPYLTARSQLIGDLARAGPASQPRLSHPTGLGWRNHRTAPCRPDRRHRGVAGRQSGRNHRHQTYRRTPARPRRDPMAGSP